MKIDPYEAQEIPDIIIRLQAQAKDKHISKEKILKDIRNVPEVLFGGLIMEALCIPKNVIELANLRMQKKSRKTGKNLALRFKYVDREYVKLAPIDRINRIKR